MDGPYTLDESGNPVYQATPWISHPDNTKDFFETGTTWSNNLALPGGAGRPLPGYFEALDQKGIIPNTDLKRTNVSLTGTLNLHPKFSAGGTISYVQNKSDNLPGGGYDANNVMQSVGGWFGRQVDMQPLKDHWQEDNAWGNPYNWNTSYHNNPYWTVYNNTTSRNRDRVYGDVYLKYNILAWLDIMGRIGTDFYTENRKNVIADRSNENQLGGEFWQSKTFEQETNADLILRMNKDLAEDFSLNAALGGNYRNYIRDFEWMRAPALTVPNLYTISNVSGEASNSMNTSEKETNSLYGSVSLGYKRFLYLDLTGRNDWSSTLPSTNWSYFYPSVSMSYVFTETFKISEKILSYGKIRASWAQVGNDTDPYQTIGTYSQLDFNNGPINPISGVAQFHYPYVVPPLDLKPEETTSIEIGTDLKFLKNRLGLDFTWYDKTTKDQILAVDISNATGFRQMLINAGEIENKGVELVVFGKVLEKKDGLNWDISINWSKNTNTVNELYRNIEAYQIAKSWQSVTIEARPGEPYGQIKGGAYVRDNDGNILIDPSTGFPVHSAQPEVIGNILPDWLWGVRNSFYYKDLSLSFLLDGRSGGDIFSVTDWFGHYAGTAEETADGDIRETGMIADGVYGYINDNGSVQYTDANGNDVSSSVTNSTRVAAEDYYHDYWGLHRFSVIDGTFIKLREIVLGWNFQKNGWVKLVGYNL